MRSCSRELTANDSKPKMSRMPMNSGSGEGGAPLPSCSLMKPTAQSKTAAKMAFARPSRVYAALCASRGTVTDSALPCATVVILRVVSACCSAAPSSPNCPAARSSAAADSADRVTLESAPLPPPSPPPVASSPMAPRPAGPPRRGAVWVSSSAASKATSPRWRRPARRRSIWPAVSPLMLIVASAAVRSANSALSSCSWTATTPDWLR
mmetsp:Transcript_87195/g.262002  ORF Transcript_87195/g.262002 Transcript_87195/m.262002 type:complete len:209 (-) Transcript_87195:1528-2154(-)